MIVQTTYDRALLAAQRLAEGKVNSIPLSFPRFKSIFPGFVRGQYWGITAGSSVGKTRFARFLMYTIYKECKKNNIPFTCLYFALEGSTESFVDATTLMMVSEKKRKNYNSKHIGGFCGFKADDNILADLKEVTQEVNEFYEHFRIYDSVSEPDEMLAIVREFMENTGKYYNKDNEESNYLTADRYVPNDPERYVFVVVDHLSLLDDISGDTQSSMDKWSTQIATKVLTKLYKVNCIDIQQQAAETQKKEYYKGALLINKLLPSYSGLGDYKRSYRNWDICIGLFSPYQHLDFNVDEKYFRGYDIEQLKNNYRAAIILKDRHFGCEGKYLHLFMDGDANLFHELPKAESMTPEMYKTLIKNYGII